MKDLFKEPNNLTQMYVLSGKSGRGKTTFIKYLIYHLIQNENCKFGLVFVKTKFNDDYTSFLPSNRVIEGFREDILKKYIHNLKKIKQKQGKIPHSFIVFDDLIGVLKPSMFLDNLYATFRHYKINLILSAQYITAKNGSGIPPIVRCQTNYAIMYRAKDRRTLENLYEAFGGLFPSFQEFKDYFLLATSEKYQAMCYCEKFDDVENNYFTIQCPYPLPNIKLEF
jgi:hypothetical protein